MVILRKPLKNAIWRNPLGLHAELTIRWRRFRCRGPDLQLWDCKSAQEPFRSHTSDMLALQPILLEGKTRTHFFMLNARLLVHVSGSISFHFFIVPFASCHL